MKNLKKLRKDQLKGISGGANVPVIEYCMYYCSGTIICAACTEDFKCPVTTEEM
ncbi:bacteriocin-like protein [Chryseobacterium sp. MYb328]|uniref:bacteriocin-like protein n=1 Tax=Chryseobacterium sp. MYb328 TaxID=2745231 RepID=UPI0030A212A0